MLTIEAYHLVSGQYQTTPVLEKRMPDKLRFLTLSPHSGLYVPKIAVPFLHLEDETITQELFNDADPYTDMFDFTSLGGLSINARIHRAFGDLNRESQDTSENGFIREKSFQGIPLLKKPYDSEVTQQLTHYHQFFRETVQQEIQQFSRPLFILHLHSMDAVTPSSYGSSTGQERPDICLAVGNPGTYCRPTLLPFLEEGFSRAFADLTYSVKVNDPFKGNNAALMLEFGKPAEGLDSVELEINKRIYLSGQALAQQKTALLETRLATAIESLLHHF